MINLDTLQKEIKRLQRKNKLLEEALKQDHKIHNKYKNALDLLEEKDRKMSELNIHLEESCSMLQNLTENIPGMIFQYRLYPDGRTTFPYASRGINDIYEVSSSDVLENTKLISEALHKDDFEMIALSVKDSEKSMNEWKLEYRVNLPLKGERWLSGRAKPEKLDDGSVLWYGFINDITEQKNTQDELKKEHKYLQSIIDGVEDPIMVIKKDYTVEIMNTKLRESLVSAKIANIAKPKCYEISHHRLTPCDGFEHPCPLKKVLATEKHTIVVHNHGTNGINRYMELSASPLFDLNNNCIGIIESTRDITAHLSIQDELREQKKILNHQALHDSLTELPNRAYFKQKLQNAIKIAKYNERKAALLFIDLDHFKEINDSLGHATGDEVLKVVTQRLKNTVRAKDTVSRLGGDEFTIILEDLTVAQDSSFIATKILDVLSRPIIVNDNTLYVSSSIGISIYPDDGESVQNLLKFADSAMYKAKDEGRNNYQYYNSTMTQLAFKRVAMEVNLRSAIENKEFVVYYQPQINAVTGKLIGMEALVRWEHPTMGLVFPGQFIPLAESTGLIVGIDRLVMQTAMSQISQWYSAGLNPGVLSLNLAIKNLEQKDFFTILEQFLTEMNCKPEWIELEVTEGHIMTHPEEAIQILQKIRNIGIELAVDDFGTGYSSLAYLKKLPINKLKIDQTFIRELPDNEDDAGITKAVIALAKSLNLKIIAEGVKTIEQKDFLINNGCENIQGYFYSRPIPANKMEEFMKNYKEERLARHNTDFKPVYI